MVLPRSHRHCRRGHRLHASPRDGTIFFQRRDLALFSELSHDHNPLHTDAEYSARTPFGQQLIHGVQALLCALCGVREGRPLILKRLSAQFFKPLVPDLRYQTRYQAVGPGLCRLEVVRDRSLKLSCELEYAPVDLLPLVDPSQAFPPPHREPLELTAEQLPGASCHGRYTPHWPRMAQWLQSAGLDQPFLPPAQFATLAWFSYVLGTELPGRRGLTCGVEANFQPGSEGAEQAIGFELKVDGYDRRFSLVTLSGSNTGAGGAPLALVKCTVQLRPQRVPIPFDQLERALGPPRPSADRVALVTGASRGLGGAVAYGLAVRGYDVIACYQRSEGAAQALAQRVEALGRKCTLLRGDLSEGATWDEIVATLAQSIPRLDLFVNAAFPSPLAAKVGELAPEHLHEGLVPMAWAALVGYQRVLPLLDKLKGAVLQVGHRAEGLGAREPPVLAMCKAAIEALFAAAALENPHLRCLLLRPPKMLTDRTNVGLDLEPKVSIERVVSNILERLDGPRSKVAGVELVDALSR